MSDYYLNSSQLLSLLSIGSISLSKVNEIMALEEPHPIIVHIGAVKVGNFFRNLKWPVNLEKPIKDLCYLNAKLIPEYQSNGICSSCPNDAECKAFIKGDGFYTEQGESIAYEESYYKVRRDEQVFGPCFMCNVPYKSCANGTQIRCMQYKPDFSNEARARFEAYWTLEDDMYTIYVRRYVSLAGTDQEFKVSY